MKDNRMKSITKLLLAACAAVALTSATRADEPLLSPRTSANQPGKISGAGREADLVRGQNDLGVAAQSKASGSRSAIAGTSKNDPDLAHSQGAVTGSPKGVQQLRESGRAFQVAPLK